MGIARKELYSMKETYFTMALWKQKTYAWGLCIGILSGMLWGLNNFLFARGYALFPISNFSQKLDAFSLSIYIYLQ